MNVYILHSNIAETFPWQSTNCEFMCTAKNLEQAISKLEECIEEEINDLDGVDHYLTIIRGWNKFKRDGLYKQQDNWYIYKNITIIHTHKEKIKH